VDRKPVVPFESFAIASWLLLDACMVALPELRERRVEILDRVALMIERLQVDADGNAEIVEIYAGAHRLVEGSIRREKTDD